MLENTPKNSTGAIRKTIASRNRRNRDDGTLRRATKTSNSDSNIASTSDENAPKLRPKRRDEIENGDEDETQPVQEYTSVRRKLNVISQNMRSLSNKHHILENVATKFSADIILLSEHWQKHEELEQITIFNYNLGISSCRTNQRGGGVAIFIKNDINAINRNDILEIDKNIEFCAIELRSRINFIIVALYRPPSADFKAFKERFAVLLEILYNNNKLAIIGGDINIDYRKNPAEWQELCDLCAISNFCWTTKEPTRVSGDCSSCIDNFFVNFSEDAFEMVVSEENVSDHRTLVLKNVSADGNGDDIYKDRFDLDRLIRFKSLLENESWMSVHRCDCPSAAFTKFREIFSSYNSMCFSGIKMNKLQIGSLVKREIKENLLFLKGMNSRHPLVLNGFRKYELFFKEFSQDEIEEDNQYITDFVDLNMSKLELYITRRHSNLAEIPLNSNLPDNVPNINNLSKRINEYFTSALIQINAIRDNNNANYDDIDDFLLKIAIESSILLTPITSEDVEIIIKKLSTSTTSGYDDITSFIVKYSTPFVLPIITKLINQSFKKGSFPSDLKTYLIKTVFVGKGDYKDLGNYNQIFIQSVFSKLYEAALNLKIINYLTEFNLLKSNYNSINTGLFSSLKQIYTGLDKRKYCLGLYLDLSGIFDAIDHDLLIYKLKYYGIKNRALDWIKSYLENREYNNIGLPKTSVLSDTLFKIYTNDLIRNIAGGVILHTLNLLVPIVGETLQELNTKTKRLHLKFKKWMLSNKLSINDDEFHYIYFHKKRQPITTLNIDNKIYKIKTSIKFLGLIIDKSLDWGTHTDNIYTNLLEMCKTVINIRKNYSLDAALIFYFCNFIPCMSYGIIFWGALLTQTKKIFKLQNRTLKIILGLKQNALNKNDFKFNSVLTLYDIYILNVLYFVHKNKIEFSKNKINHSYETHNKNHLVLPPNSTAAFQKSIYYKGCQFYNILPTRFKVTSNFDGFKKEVEAYLLQINCFSIDDFLNFKHN